MFKHALGELLTVVFTCIILFQPPLHELFNVRSNAVELVLNQGIAQASSYDNGRFTPEIIQQMKDHLTQKFFVRESDIEFTGTTTITPRGEYIEGRLTIKATPFWLFSSLFGEGPETISRHATMMSEYVER